MEDTANNDANSAELNDNNLDNVAGGSARVYGVKVNGKIIYKTGNHNLAYAYAQKHEGATVVHF